MITRILCLADDPATRIPVHLTAPVESPPGDDWSCRIEIGWPDRTVVRDIVGVDAVQALQLAMQMIGTELYVSDLHKAGRLMWQERGRGYGFPVTRNIRHLLIGDDRRMM
jgi:hypothetical protein